MSDLRFPIGPFAAPSEYAPALRQEFISQIVEAPALLRRAVTGLNATQVQTPYREGGWTIAQVVHHLPDSHANAYMRCKLALTETDPTIKPYNEARWAETPEATSPDLRDSLDLLDALHRRWTALLRHLTADQFDLRFVHPDRGPMTLDRVLALYAWHGRHHTAHITRLRDRMNW